MLDDTTKSPDEQTVFRLSRLDLADDQYCAAYQTTTGQYRMTMFQRRHGERTTIVSFQVFESASDAHRNMQALGSAWRVLA